VLDAVTVHCENVFPKAEMVVEIASLSKDMLMQPPPATIEVPLPLTTTLLFESTQLETWIEFDSDANTAPPQAAQSRVLRHVAIAELKLNVEEDSTRLLRVAASAPPLTAELFVKVQPLMAIVQLTAATAPPRP